MIVDSLSAHKEVKVEKWLEEHEKRIRMFFLPTYSPELNPDEKLNQDVKSNAIGRKKPRTEKEMVKNLRGYLRGQQRRPEVVKRYFHKETVRYAAL